MKEELIKMKNVLMLVDTLKGFRTIGPMAVPGLEHTDEAIEELVIFAIENGYEIISIEEGHTENSIEFNDYPPHAINGTEEAELIDRLKPYRKYMKVIKKNSTSGFVTKEYQEYLEANKYVIRRIVYCGYLFDICVPNVAIPTKMFFNENNIPCEVIVPENTTETFDSPTHPRKEYKTLAKKMLLLNGIKVPEKYEG